MKINIDENVKNLLNILNVNKNYYLVGGYLRDKLLGINSLDVDIATDSYIQEILEKLNLDSYEIISDKLQIIAFKYNDKKIQIAKMREDIKYFSNRKDFTFYFTDDINVDLNRRDFTINTLAYDLKNFYYLDETLTDIQNKILRSVGNADKKFKEDPMRILRGLRFFSEKSLLNIEKNTYTSMQKNIKLIWNLPNEVIKNELIKIIKGENYLNTIKIMNEINFFEQDLILSDYTNDYNERIFKTFSYEHKELLQKLNFSKKIIRKIKED